MTLEAYEYEVLRSMFDKEIIKSNYKPIQTIASKIKWPEIANKYGIRKKFKRVIKHLDSKGLVDLHGKSGNVGSLSKLGVDYVLGMKK